MTEQRNGIKFIAEFDSSEPIVSMIEFNGTVLIATARRVFRVEDDKMVPLTFELVEEDGA